MIRDDESREAITEEYSHEESEENNEISYKPPIEFEQFYDDVRNRVA